MDQETQPAPPTSGETHETQGTDSLTEIDAKETTLLFGIVPVVAIGLLILVGAILYHVRKKKLEGVLANEMRMDDGELVNETHTTNINTRDLQDLDPTKPSNRLKKKND